MVKQAKLPGGGGWLDSNHTAHCSVDRVRLHKARIVVRGTARLSHLLPKFMMANCSYHIILGGIVTEEYV